MARSRSSCLKRLDAPQPGRVAQGSSAAVPLPRCPTGRPAARRGPSCAPPLTGAVRASSMPPRSRMQTTNRGRCPGRRPPLAGFDVPPEGCSLGPGRPTAAPPAAQTMALVHPLAGCRFTFVPNARRHLTKAASLHRLKCRCKESRELAQRMGKQNSSMVRGSGQPETCPARRTGFCHFVKRHGTNSNRRSLTPSSTAPKQPCLNVKISRFRHLLPRQRRFGDACEMAADS